MKIEFTLGPGVIADTIVSWCDKAASSLKRGFLASGISEYGKCEDAIDNASIKKNVRERATVNSGLIRRIKYAVSHQFEESLLIGLFGSLVTRLMTTSLRVYGSFFMTYGIYSALVYLVRSFILNSSVPMTLLICGIIVSAASIPMLLSGKILAEALNSGIVMKWLLGKVLDVPEEKFRYREANDSRQSMAVLAGVICGMLTYFISPAVLPAVILVLVAISMIMSFPEAGVVLIVAAAPFMSLIPAPSITLGALTLLTAFAYAVKIIRGKRTFRFSVSDLAVLLLWLCLLSSNLSPAYGSTENALLSSGLMLVYFLVVNLIRDKRWLKVCFGGMVVSSTAISVLGIIRYFMGLAPGGWIDTDLFPEITSRATSTFDNPNVLAVYLIMAFPMSLALQFTLKKKPTRILAGLSSALIFLCVVLTWSRSAWLGLIIGSFFMLTVMRPRCAALLIPAAAGVGAGAVIFPDTFGKRILNIFSLTDSANYYRLYTWKGVSRMLGDCWSAGVGAGEIAFRSVYLNYAYPGIEAAPHAHSLYLQITAQCGVLGLVLLLAAIIVVIWKGLAYVTSERKRSDGAVICLACLGGFAAVLVEGIFDYPWYNYRVFFVFWALVGMICAAADIGKNEQRSLGYNDSWNEYSVDTVIGFDEE